MFRILCSVLLAAALVATPLLQAPARADTRVPEASFDHLRFDALLRKYVVNGRVRYRAWKLSAADRAALNAYVATLDKPLLGRMNPSSKLAFYINAYNAIVLKSVLDSYPVKSTRQIPGMFDREVWHIGRQVVSLDDIETKILRPTWHDPRILFALSRASKGYPALREHTYNGLIIEQELTEAVQRFLDDRYRAIIDYTGRTLYLSRMFEWHRDEIVAWAGSIPGFIATQLADPAAQMDLRRGEWKVRYLSFDEALNDY